MKKLLLISLMMLSGSAWAAWVKFEENDTFTAYFDPATIRKDGSMRRIWELQDLKRRDRNGDMSLQMRKEYDCKNERYRILGISGHSEPMARGKVLGSENEYSQWIEIPPNSVSEAVLKIVCAK